MVGPWPSLTLLARLTVDWLDPSPPSYRLQASGFRVERRGRPWVSSPAGRSEAGVDCGHPCSEPRCRRHGPRVYRVPALECNTDLTYTCSASASPLCLHSTWVQTYAWAIAGNSITP